MTLNLRRYSATEIIAFVLFLVSLLLVLHRALDLRIIIVFSIFSILFLRLFKLFDIKAALITLFGLLYSVLCYMNGMNTSLAALLSIVFAPVAYYLFGKKVAARSSSPLFFVVLLGIIAFVFSSELYYRIIVDIQEFGYVKLSHHMGDEMDEELNATLYALNASLGLAGFSILFTEYRKKLWLSLFFLSLSILSFITVTHLVSRTGLVVIVFVLIAIIIYNMGLRPSSVLALILVSSLFVVGFLFLSDSGSFSDVLSAYVDKGERAGGSWGTASSRSYRWSLALKNLVLFPLGWSADYRDYYAHNLWLDVDRVTGLIPFIILLAVSIMSFKDLFRLLKSNNKSVATIVFAMYLTILLCCFVEPVIEGLIVYFYIYMFFIGITNQLSKSKQILIRDYK